MVGTPALILVAHGSAQETAASVQKLQQENFRVELVGDAASLLTAFARLSPQAILLDGALPGGDAYAICARLHGESKVPILMLTPNDADEIGRALRAGAKDVLTKPVVMPLLCLRLRALIDGQKLADQNGEHERRWQQIFERNRAIQLIVNPQSGQIIDANPAACALYGYSREEFLQKAITDIDVPVDWDDEQPSMFSFRHRLASGETRDVSIFSNPMERDGQMLLYLIVSAPKWRRPGADDDQRRLAEALRNTASVLSSTLDQNEVLDRILEQVNSVVPNDSANIMLIEANVARVARARGYEGRVTPVTMDGIRLKVQEVPLLNWMIENNSAIAMPDTDASTDWVMTDPAYGWLKSYVAAPIRIGNHVIGFLNLDSAIPNRFTSADADRLQAFADQAAIAIRNARLYDRVRHQAAEMERRVQQRTSELEYERGQLRAIMDAMTEGVAYTEAVDDDYRTRYVNRALSEITGYSAEEWNQHSLALFHNKTMSDAEFDALLNTAIADLRQVGFWRTEIRLMRKNGTEFDASVITTRIDGQNGEIASAVSVIRDISKEKALQQQKERFVAHASHELRTPITNLKTRLYLMRRQPERIEEHMRVLEQVTDRMKRLAEDLLDISRFERGVIEIKREPVVLQEMIENLVLVQRAEAERKHLTLGCTLPDEPTVVFADAERLAQVITNLMINGINYTPEGGRIDVRLSRVDEGGEPQAVIEVEDTGIGIGEEHLPHIFQPFYRVVSQVEGTGLGLSITKEIVELHGGSLTVTSHEGEGSCFRFSLPLITTPELSESSEV